MNKKWKRFIFLSHINPEKNPFTNLHFFINNILVLIINMYDTANLIDASLRTQNSSSELNNWNTCTHNSKTKIYQSINHVVSFINFHVNQTYMNTFFQIMNIHNYIYTHTSTTCSLSTFTYMFVLALFFSISSCLSSFIHLK